MTHILLTITTSFFSFKWSQFKYFYFAAKFTVSLSSQYNPNWWKQCIIPRSSRFLLAASRKNELSDMICLCCHFLLTIDSTWSILQKDVLCQGDITFSAATRETALTLMLLGANLANTKWCKKPWKITETLAHGYPSESTLWELSNE